MALENSTMSDHCDYNDGLVVAFIREQVDGHSLHIQLIFRYLQ